MHTHHQLKGCNSTRVIVEPAIDTDPRYSSRTGRRRCSAPPERQLLRVDIEQVVGADDPLETDSPLIADLEVRHIAGRVDAVVEHAIRVDVFGLA